jgi:hypothetical protein
VQRALLLVHLVGLALGAGSAAVKTSLLLGCRADPALVPGYARVAKRVTPLLVSGFALLTLSGIAWLVLGYPFTPRLVVKLALVVGVGVIGATIDKVLEPAFVRLAPPPGAAPTTAFLSAQRRHLAAEVIATTLFVAIIALGVWL